MIPILAAVGAGISSGAKASAEAQAGQPQPQPVQQSPTSAFIEASRQANLERQQQDAAQMQTTPTALMGQQQLVGQAPPVQAQGLNAPPAGMLSQQGPDMQALANMFRMRAF